MLRGNAVEFIPKNHNFNSCHTKWDKKEKEILSQFNIDDNYKLNDDTIDWKIIERDIYLENLKQNYEDTLERANTHFNFVVCYDKFHFNGYNFILLQQNYIKHVEKINYDYLVQRDEIIKKTI